MREIAGYVQHKMTGWYDPRQLADTGVQVLVSELLGTRSDYRVLESFGAAQQIFDFSSGHEVWFDYVADLGDGWDSTYTVASLLSVDRLVLKGPEGTQVPTERGRLLVMGGDEVYPLASREGYQERLVGPYECALPLTQEPHPTIFALPGNHDWYDGLVSFMRLFGQGRWLGGWQTAQRRSYFAIKLPHRWWLWGVDVQLESDIDQPQLEYFCKVAEDMCQGDRVILATAEPHWIYGNIYGRKYQNNLAFLEKNLIRDRAGAKLQIALAGDLHHYRRHEAEDGSAVQLITAGGGGAFLHPTFGPDVTRIEVGKEPSTSYRLRAEFPDQKTSKRLLLRDFLFPVLNPKFGMLSGALYLVIAWIYRSEVIREYAALPPGAGAVARIAALVRALLSSPAGFFWVLAVALGVIFFTDTHKKVYKYIGGGIHAAAHLIGIVLVSWVAAQFAAAVARSNLGTLSNIILTAAAIFVGGYVVGSFLMGVYLYISLRVFRRHANEAFSALRISDYKSFVRFHIDQAGDLTILPVGLERVPRRWVASTGPVAKVVPAPRERLAPALIEQPIRLPGPRPS